MYQKNYQEVEGIVKATKSGWTIDFKKLTELTNGHKDFIADVRRCLKENEEHGWLNDIKVFTWKRGAGPGSHRPWVGVAFRVPKGVSYLACNAATTPYVIQAHYNEDFVAQMAEIL